MSWPIVFAALFLMNLTFCGLMFCIQQIELENNRISRRGSIIPGTNQKFLHWQDFKCQLWGCTLFLPAIALAFFTLLHAGKISNEQMGFSSLFLGGSMIYCLNIGFKSNHKPDWGYPAVGAMSMGGALHCLYFGLYITITVLCLFHIIWTKELRGLVMWIALAGGMAYLITFVFDSLAGRFDRLKLKDGSKTFLF